MEKHGQHATKTTQSQTSWGIMSIHHEWTSFYVSSMLKIILMR